MFITFLIPLSFRRRINWKEYGLVTAFFVSLFIEMYGLPLSILFVSKTIYPTNIGIARVVYEFEFLGVNIAMDMAMLYASILIIIGTLFILVGWITLYKNIKKQNLVTTGIYSYSRHPQYLGFLLIILGWLIGWPTILTTIFAVILVYKYVKVCKIEEKELANIESYKKYKEKVPFFF
jgi:protein-S-isoprenylcysteine O-methyltransferase Ste14